MLAAAPDLPPPPAPAAVAAATKAAAAGAHVLVEVRPGRRALLRNRPGGKVVLRAKRRTEYGSARVYWAQEIREGWAGVRDARHGNRRLAWVKLDTEALRVRSTRWHITVDRSQRSLTLRHDGRVIRRVRVAVGRPGSPTPLGRFSVTDKLKGGGYYGCCIIGLSGTQPKLPRGWAGGNRLAIHGTNAPGSIGSAASAGCVRASDRDMRAVWSRIPLGTPVHIRS